MLLSICGQVSAEVVFDSPLLDHDLCLLQRIKDFSIQTLIPQLHVEALAVTVLPRTARLDVQCSGPHIVSMMMETCTTINRITVENIVDMHSFLTPEPMPFLRNPTP